MRGEDFEYFHEIRCKMNSNKLQEIVEAPRLESSKFFYNPTRAYLIRKDQHKTTNNKRRAVKRR
jgi:hypothetical protein